MRRRGIARDDRGLSLPRRPDDEELTVPREAAELFRGTLAAMAADTSVQVIPVHAELTTQQAANLIGVCRPHLLNLIEAGQIEYRSVGTHRRVLVASLRVTRGTDLTRAKRACRARHAWQAGCYTRRINIQHRLVYEVFPDSRIVHVLRMWTRYE